MVEERSFVIPPSHWRRGATTVFGQNRHHRSDTASSFSLFFIVFPYPSHMCSSSRCYCGTMGGITAEPRRCHCGHGDPIELPLRFDGGATAIIGGRTAVLAAALRGQWGATAGLAVLLRWRCGRAIIACSSSACCCCTCSNCCMTIKFVLLSAILLCSYC